MSRNQTNTVTYFSHDSDASERKTLTILKGIYGMAGIGFWWTLLEWLAKTENHVIKVDNEADLEFLLQKWGFPLQEGTEILGKLASLNAIDPILWEHGVIWSDNFIQRLDNVYKKRHRNLPKKPNYCNGNCDHSLLLTTIPVTEMPIFGTGSTQSKVKYSKEYNIYISDSIKKLEDAGMEIDGHFRKFVEIYETKVGMQLNQRNATLLQELADEYPLKWFEEAIEEALKRNVRELKYIEKILRSRTEKVNLNGTHKQGTSVYTEAPYDPELDE